MELPGVKCDTLPSSRMHLLFQTPVYLASPIPILVSEYLRLVWGMRACGGIRCACRRLDILEIYDPLLRRKHVPQCTLERVFCVKRVGNPQNFPPGASIIIISPNPNLRRRTGAPNFETSENPVFLTDLPKTRGGCKVHIP